MMKWSMKNVMNNAGQVDSFISRCAQFCARTMLHNDNNMPPIRETSPSSSLPRWAKIITPNNVKKTKKTAVSRKEEPLDTCEEECYLRTVSYHALSREMDRAVSQSLRHLSLNMQNELEILQEQVLSSPLTSSVKSNSPEIATEVVATENENMSTGGNNERVDDVICSPIEPSRRYSPFLLPVLILEGPSYGLDRQEWMLHLVLSTRKKRLRSCVVWLNKNNTSSPYSSLSFQQELTRQCLIQEPDLPKALKNKRSLNQASYTDILAMWAANTESFDDIVIFLDNNNNSDKGEELQDFLRWTAERRCLKGLPFTVILWGNHSGRRPLEVRSASGPVGLLVRRCVLPSARHLLDTFWTTLTSLNQNETDFPIAFPNEVLSSIHDVFREQNGSAIHCVLKLKHFLAHKFSARGSFLTVYGNELSPIQNERRRMDWFLLDPAARRLIKREYSKMSKMFILKNLQKVELCRRKARISFKILKMISEIRRSNVPLLFLGTQVHDSLEKSIESRNRQEIISLLLHLRTQTPIQTQPRKDDDLAMGNAVIDFINELIVLTDNYSHVSDAEICARELIDDWAQKSSATLDDDDNGEALASLEVQLRRCTVVGLIEEIPESPKSASFAANIVSRMYRLIRDRVAISQDEWLYGVRGSMNIPENITRQEIFSLFICGVKYLKLCGLIREKRPIGRAEVVYEKTVMVWCGFDE